MRKPFLRGAMIVGIIASAIVVSAALSRIQAEPPQREFAALPPLVEVLELRAEDRRLPVRSQGTVEPATQTALSAEVSGVIVAVSPKFVVGGLFKAGEVLLQVDPSDYRVAVSQAEALVSQRRIEHEGAARLREQGYRAEVEYASTAAALASAEADLVRARRNLERTAIRLPYDGLVRSKSADLGQFVSPGTPLGVVFATDRAEVRLPLTNADLAFLELPGPASDVGPGNAPRVTLEGIHRGEPKSWPAVVVREEGVIDARNRMTYVVARIDDPYALAAERPPLPVGSFVSATIRSRPMPDLVRIPGGALRRGTQLLFLDDDDRLLIGHADVVQADEQYAYLRADDLPARRIVLTAVASPVDGLQVRILHEESPTRIAAATGDSP